MDFDDHVWPIDPDVVGDGRLAVEQGIAEAFADDDGERFGPSRLTPCAPQTRTSSARAS